MARCTATASSLALAAALAALSALSETSWAQSGAGDGTGSSAAPAAAPAATPSGDDGASTDDNTSAAGDSTSGASAAPASGGASEEGGEATAAEPPAEEPPAPLTADQQRLLVPAGGDVTDREAGAPYRLILPPLYVEEWGSGHHTRVLFPLFFQSRINDDNRLFTLFYYQRRAPRERSDVAFPFYFRYRGTDPQNGYSTDIVPPVWYATTRGPGRAHSMWTGVAPLFSYRAAYNEEGRLQSEHLVLPALLTYHQWWPTGQATVVGPAFYFRNHSETTWGVLPLVFHHREPAKSWTLIPPLLTYHSVSYTDNSTFTLVGPFFTESGPDMWSYNLAPVFFSRHERDRTRVTLLPLFHTQWGPDELTVITPLGGYSRDHDESTLITPIYQNHRGLTDIDAIAPVFYFSRTPRLGKRTMAMLPIGFYSTSRTGFSWGLFPFAARFHEYSRYDTVATPLFVHSENHETNSSVTWVFPTIHHETHPDSHILNVYPFYFSAGGRRWHHQIVFPFYWDITDDEEQQQINVLFPFYVRVRNHRSVIQWVFPNHFYWENTVDGVRSFGWDLFPFIQYGEPRPGDNYWSVLYGLIGHSRTGRHERTQVFWMSLGGGNNASPSPSPAPRAHAPTRPGDLLIDL